MTFSEIKEKFCENFCKWPEKAREEIKDVDEADDWLVNERCSKCPLEYLEGKDEKRD